MAARKLVRRKARRVAPKVRRIAGHRVTAVRAQAKKRMQGTEGLMIGGVHDPAEKAADRVADRVMRMAEPVGPVRRECAECAAEEKARRQAAVEEEEETARARPAAGVLAPGAASSPAPAAAKAAVGGLGHGRALPRAERSFFEPRFGVDLGEVRIHDDAAGGRAARALDARAFTLGPDIAFAPGERAPGTPGGDRLLAHELAHVVQRRAALRRAVGTNSRCRDNSHGAPTNALDHIRRADEMAVAMCRNAGALLLISAADAGKPGFRTDSIVSAYYDWFGGPRQLRNGRFRSRFGGTFTTEDAAAAHEMKGFDTRFSRVDQWLSGSIRYLCPGTRRFTILGCTPARCGGSEAVSCPTGTRMIVVCPAFWNVGSEKGRGSIIAHEAMHARLRFGGHPAGRRERNPACYDGFLRQVFQVTDVADAQCTAIVRPGP
jgi:Domain of unknown function (DUF4157)